MKNILVLASKTGGGHIAGANALASFLEGDDFHFTILSQYQQDWLYSIFPQAYAYALKARFIWELVWTTTDHPWIKGILEKTGKKLFETNKDAFEKTIPDLVLSVHPLLNETARQIGIYCNIPSATFIQDPFTVHYSWYAIPVDHVLVPFDETKTAMKEPLALPATVLTYPVKQAFLTETINPEDVFSLLHLKKQPTIVLSAGGEGVLPIAYIKALLNTLDENTNIIIVCGKNEKLYNKVIRIVKNKKLESVLVLGFTDNMHEILSIADIHLMKAGPNTLFETLVCETIPFIFDYIKYQEVGNVSLVEEKKLGKSGSFLELLKELSLSDEEKDLFKERIRLYLQNIRIYDQEALFRECLGKILR